MGSWVMGGGFGIRGVGGHSGLGNGALGVQSVGAGFWGSVGGGAGIVGAVGVWSMAGWVQGVGGGMRGIGGSWGPGWGSQPADPRLQALPAELLLDVEGVCVQKLFASSAEVETALQVPAGLPLPRGWGFGRGPALRPP